MNIHERMSLKGKRALVTGSSRGIGKAIAFALGDAGAEIILHGSSRNGALEQTWAEAEARGLKASILSADLAAHEQRTALCSLAGTPDILVLNASIQKYQPLDEIQQEDFAAQFSVNVEASIELIRAFLPAMRTRNWGRVISIGSVNQWKQSPRLPVYAASKSALLNLMTNFARIYAKDGVTFNNIAPGVIATDRNREVLSDAASVEKLLGNIPSKRFGTPEDCAGIALLLASDAGSYITGADIAVAGGMQL